MTRLVDLKNSVLQDLGLSAVTDCTVYPRPKSTTRRYEASGCHHAELRYAGVVWVEMTQVCCRWKNDWSFGGHCDDDSVSRLGVRGPVARVRYCTCRSLVRSRRSDGPRVPTAHTPRPPTFLRAQIPLLRFPPLSPPVRTGCQCLIPH